MKSTALRWKTWTCCLAVAALFGGAGGCSHTDLDVPNAGPALAADTQRIYESEAFTAFAKSAHLSQSQGVLVARTLALYGENEDSIRVTAKSPANLNDMHRQLVGDTVAHLQLQIPPSAWDAFTQSGLLPHTEAP